MFRPALLALALMTVIGLASLTVPEPSQTVPQPADTAITTDSTFDQEKALAELWKRIEGMEDNPTEMVFYDIQIMFSMSAGRLLRIMEMGFSKSLGVDCTYCHNPDSWESSEKPAKEVSREMWRMVERINKDLLAPIEGLESEKPAVNCTTCHRGEKKPALRMK